ncbi:MAG: MarR family transcriptional regulator [Proteobacteria bacterium]|jgi:homoprotocatechuate degradation regulator HpaR|nr:MarR family transcriptional regulator [Pseudomonadota bacterium]
MAMQDFSHSLPMLLYRALDAVMPRFRRVFTAAGLTEQQWRVLRVLWERDEVAHNALAALTLIPQPSLIGVLDRLAGNGLVVRRRSESDRRVMYVSATAAGRDLEEKLMPEVAKVYAELKASLDRDTWTQLESGLRALAGEPPAATATTTRASSTRSRKKP